MGIPPVGRNPAGPSPTAAAAPHVPGRPRGEGLLAELQANVSSEGALFRFQAHRQLAEEMTGHQLTFQAEIGLRSQGALLLHNNLLRLANLSALQLIGLRVHVPRLQLSTLAQTLQDYMRHGIICSNHCACKTRIIYATPTQ